jgi:aminoglycoside/choline kinase family phosphotransferase
VAQCGIAAAQAAEAAFSRKNRRRKSCLHWSPAARAGIGAAGYTAPRMNSNPSRRADLHRFVVDELGPNASSPIVASADASFRCYWRVRVGERSLIVMDAPPDKENLAPWLDVDARLRAAGLNAPEVLAVDQNLGFVLLADLGVRTYLPELDAVSADALYGDAFDALLRMQTQVDARGLPVYDRSLLIAELERMPEWFLKRHLGFTPSCDEWDIIEAAFTRIVHSSLEQPQHFVHRDYHSRNLMIVPGNNPGIIDFQDAVLGPISYDLVSLLRDCYIEWPATNVDSWVEHYRQRLVAAGVTLADSAQFRRWFDLTGLQRHLKVLGNFCRLWYRDGKAQYLTDLPLTLKYVLAVVDRHAEFAELAALLRRAIAARDIRVPAPAS